MFKNAIARMVASLLMVVLAVGEAGAKGINPAYKKWMREIGKERLQTGTEPMRRMLKTATVATDEEKLSGSNNGLSTSDSGINYGLRPSLINYSHLGIINARSSRICASESLPPKFDSRDNGWISSVKDQGEFGTCWAQAAMGAIEAKLRKDNEGTYRSLGQPDFSENNLVMQRGDDVHPYGKPDPHTGSPSEYTAGGFFEDAFKYFARWGGPILEADDPYPTKANKFSSHGSNVHKMPLFHLQEYVQYRPKNSPLDHDEIKSAIMKYGSVWVTFCVIQDYRALRFSQDSVDYFPCFSSDGKNYYNWTSYVVGDKDAKESSNHAVLLVGWDDTYAKKNFSCISYSGEYLIEPPGDGAYLIKNSWGEGSGDNGYLWVSYYDDNMLYDDSYAITSVEKVDNYSDVYQYDPLGLVYSFPDSSYKWGANVFTSTNNTSIAAVGFYSMSQGTSYTIQIYTGVTAENPVSGTCRTGAGKKGIVPHAGFTTVVLDEPIALSKGQRFSVVLSLDSPECDEPFGAEANLKYNDDCWSKYQKYGVNEKFSFSLTSKASASAGQSFVSKDGTSGTWRDITTEISPICVDESAPFLNIGGKDYFEKVMFDTSSANLCIKAYMQSQSVSTELKDVEIAGTDTSVVAGGRITLSCTASYNNAPAKDVTGSATWSIVRGYGDDVATVVSPGVIETVEVEDARLVRVQAKYSEDGISKSDTWDFYVTVAPPTPPTDLVATEGEMDAGIRLNWTAPKGATYYSVYRSVASDSSKAKCIASKITDHQYFDNGESLPGEPMIPGKDYYYFIKAGNAAGYNKNFSNGAMGWRKLSAPETVTASNGTREDAVELKWSEVSGAKYYHVYRSEEIEGTKTELGSWQTDTQYEDKTAEPGVTYYYYVIAAVDNRGSRPSDYSIIEDGYRGVPVVPVGLEIIGESSIPSGGNRTYSCTVIKSDDTREENVAATWSLATTKAARLSGSKIYAYDVTENTKVVLTAAYGSLRQDLEVTITAVKPDPPTSLTLLSANEKGVYFQWAPVLGAAGYKIYRHDGTTETVIAEINDGEAYKYTDKTAVPGVKYTYRISSLNSAGEGDKSSKSLEVTIGLAAPTGVMATSDDSAQVTVSWQKVAGATYYRVYRAESQTGTKTALGSWQTAFTYPDKGGTAGKEYYYFVCGATTSMGANAGPFSEGVTGKRPVAVTLSSIAITGGGTKVASGGKMTLSCLATYSDNTEKSVTPTWNVSPTTYATIDAAGQFSAKSVTADQKVTVTASFGGKTDAREIKIIAPVVATAKVSNVKATPRWPFSNLLDVDYELQTTPEGTRAAIALSGYDNDRRVAMAAHTLSGDGADGSVAAGKRRLTWDVAADYPDFRSSSLDVELTAVAITVAAPTDLKTSSGTSSGGVNLSWTGVDDATEYEIWRGTSSASSAAGKIRSVETTSYLDDTAVAGTTYYYWVKAVSPDGASDFSKAVTGSRPYANVVIKFNGNGGTASTSQLTLTPGVAYGTLPTATRTGYSLDGWYTAASGGTKISATSIVPTSTTELFAHWKANSYSIAFNANGGSGTMSNLSMVYGTAKNLPANAFTKTGHTFAGWATSSSGAVVYGNGVSVNNLTATSGATVTLYAKWTANTYSVTLNKNGGTCTDLTSYTYGVGATLPTPTKTGNTFGGWFTTSSCTGTAVTKISPTDTGDKVFYAKWTVNTYTVTLNKNGGTCADLTSYTYGVGATLPTATKTGNTFGGWFTTSACTGTAVTKISTTDTGNKVFYAKWTGISYTIAFNANGGSGTMSNLSMVYGTAKNLTANAFTRAGYTFAGWATSSTGSVVYGNGASVNNLTATNGATVTLYAKWTGISYTIAFNANGGGGTMSNLPMVYGTAKNLTANAFYRDGYYEFSGWATSSSGSVAYGNGESVNNLTQSSGATIVLYAVWERVFDLMPLRSLLYYISSADNIISEKEMLLALKNPTICPFDNDTKYISDREMALLLQISELNQNSNLVSNVIQRNYENITEATMERLQELSDEIKNFDANPSGNVCIVYDANGGLGNMQMVVIPRGGSVTLSGNQFYGVSDDIFAGWATSPTGEVVYKNGERIDDIDSSKILYAVWVKEVAAISTAAGVYVSWGQIPGATSYEVKREESNNKSAITFSSLLGVTPQLVVTTTQIAYTDKNVTTSWYYRYTIVAKRGEDTLCSVRSEIVQFGN